MTGYRIDNLQYANWSEKIFRQMREGGLDASFFVVFVVIPIKMRVWNIRILN